MEESAVPAAAVAERHAAQGGRQETVVGEGLIEPPQRLCRVVHITSTSPVPFIAEAVPVSS